MSTRILMNRGNGKGNPSMAAGDYGIGDILPAGAVILLTNNVTHVFHAASISDIGTPEATAHRVNVEGTRLLLEAARAAGVRRLVYTSTVNTLGIPPAGIIVSAGAGQSAASFQKIDMDHPLFANIFEKDSRGRSLDPSSIESPRIVTSLKVQSGKAGRTVITLSDGSAFLSEYAVGAGPSSSFRSSNQTSPFSFPGVEWHWQRT